MTVVSWSIFVCALLGLLETVGGQSKTSRPPCCRDMLTTVTCQRLWRTNERHFSQRCNTDAEFRLIQCCTTCNRCGTAMAYDLVARSLVSEQCFDRYGRAFCQRYVNNTDVWSPMHWSCDGKNPQIAFRSCRESCGFCDFQAVQYSLDNALESCAIERNRGRKGGPSGFRLGRPRMTLMSRPSDTKPNRKLVIQRPPAV